MPRRRPLLRVATLAGLATLAGCAATDGGTTDDTRPADSDRPPDATHRATVAASDPAPDLPVRPRVSVVEPFLAPASPPVLRVDVENTTDAAVVVGEYRDVVFQFVRSGDGALVCLPHSERSTAGDPDRLGPAREPSGDACWALDSPVSVTQEYGTVEIPPNGTLTAFVGVYGTPDGGCLATGERRFEATFAHYPEGLDGPAPETATWGFSLSLTPVE